MAASEASGRLDFPLEFSHLRGNYMLYSSGLGDPKPARRDDGKIAFAITGEAARKIFDAMAPDVQDVCTAGSGVRVRTKENVSCQREKAGVYRCSFGFDLRTGKSIGGSVC
jgi:hypothetical protein